MKINFEGDLAEVIQGIEILQPFYNFDISPEGDSVCIEKCGAGISAEFTGNKGIIRYSKKIEFFRGLGLFLENYAKEKTFQIAEQSQFAVCGSMIDVSRNAVLKVETIKKLLRIMAVMGLNMMMLYTEDTYTIESQPYFGYMRGKYSYEELKECDDYADAFGIEMIPCIQTLGHMKHALKWDYAKNIKDTDDILLAGNEQTYQFIEKMIEAACAPFRSRRIHIGMDEAHNIGLGQYLKQNGYQKRFDIMSAHLDRVIKITEKYGLKPMMWSDMFFRLASKTGDYYDLEAEIPCELIKNVSDRAQMVYWDYYHSGKEFYIEYIKKHKEFSLPPVFAGGIWTWNSFCTNYTMTMAASNDALLACKQEGISEVMATMWGDDGNEANIFSALLGLQLFAEHNYAKKFDEAKLKNRFEYCTNGIFEAFKSLCMFDDVPGTDYNQKKRGKPYELAQFNPSKYLLWQDVLLGLFDKHIEGLQLNKHYNDLKVKLEKHAKENESFHSLFDFYAKLSDVLSIKSELGIKIKDFYDNDDKDSLRKIMETDIPELLRKVSQLRQAHRMEWLSAYKPFGWEVLDIRYGGLLSRLDTAKWRLEAYIDGRIPCIEELDENRIYYHEKKEPGGAALFYHNRYSGMITAGSL